MAYAGRVEIDDFRDVLGLDALGTIAGPHRWALGAEMWGREALPLFDREALPQRVVDDHAWRTVVMGPEYYAVPGYELGSFGLLQRNGRVFTHDNVQPIGFNEQLQPGGMPAHWMRGLFSPDADIIECSEPVGVATHPHLVWGHFLLEMLPRLHLLAELGRLGKPIKIAVAMDSPRWVLEAVALYFRLDQVVLYDSERQRVRASSFILPGMMMSHYCLHPAMNGMVEQLLRRVVDSSYPSGVPPKRVYLSRSRHDGWHALKNELEVEATLTDLGFVVVHPQDIPLRAQLALYAGVESIVSQYGSGAHNAIFAPIGTPVFCFGWMNRCQSGIAALRGQPMAYMKPGDCELVYPPAGHSGPFTFSVDCRRLARELPEFLRFAEAQRRAATSA